MTRDKFPIGSWWATRTGVEFLIVRKDYKGGSLLAVGPARGDVETFKHCGWHHYNADLDLIERIDAPEEFQRNMKKGDEI